MSVASAAARAPVKRIDCGGGAIPPQVFDSAEPLLLKGLVGKWPAVAGCRESIPAAERYLSRFWREEPVTVYAGDSSIDGRFFYNEDFTGFNFAAGKATLPQVFAKLAEAGREDRLSTLYIGSTPVDQWLPGFRAENDLPLPADDALASFWIGNRTRVSAHYDFPDNIACVVAGERLFTLFPPDQIGNLYVGPVDRTPSGQAISTVDFANPDFERFPKFAKALERASSALLEPGDAIFIPSMWWHHVESRRDFNLLINYWWCNSPDFMGSPSNALMHAILALRDLPPRQRELWRGVFNHYVFDADESVCEHIPEPGRGCLAPLDESKARKLKAELRNRLNR
ncbi:MAG: cupin-like domain-containing protein [Gammaproteobacteria bacterium]|nr:cupin-like domain-containing protein [Gammaproteobacteria bacterium]